METKVNIQHFRRSFLPICMALIGFFFTLSSYAEQLNFMGINTNFLWDHLAPDDGRVVKDRPSEEEYYDEIVYYTDTIMGSSANVVALSEIEGCHVADELARILSWVSVCQKGRDSFTGQDVAILFDSYVITPDYKTVTTFESVYGYNGHKKVRPSKVIGVQATTAGGKKITVAAAHFISLRSPKNHPKRHAQAEALAKGVKQLASGTPTVVIGDLNDFPNSKTLANLNEIADLKNTAGPNDCTHTYKNKCNQIDYILTTPDLAGGIFETIDQPKKFSDHKAVLYIVQMKK